MLVLVCVSCQINICDRMKEKFAQIKIIDIAVKRDSFLQYKLQNQII
jgi:hypothetical protein